MMLPPELRDFAREAFTLAGGDPSTWTDKVTLGLLATVIGTLTLLVLIVVALLARGRARG